MLKGNANFLSMDYKCSLTVCLCVCIRIVPARDSVWSETHECKPTQSTHSTMGSDRRKLMDEQMNRHLNQWMDEELEDFQDFSFSYTTI